MQFKKLIISILLLLSYSLGFTHNLIPHCGELNYVVVSKNISNHQHISRQNHADVNVLHSLSPFLKQINTPHTDCNAEHCVLLKTDDNSTKIISTKYLVKAIFVNIQKSLHFYYLSKLEKQTFPSNQNELLPDSYRIRSNSLRAPPFQ